MITLLKKFYLKPGMSLQDERTAYGKLAGMAGIILNLLLAAFKFAGGMLSGSIAVMADSMNNLSDAASSIVTLIGFRMAGQAPDPHHPYGHGRIEYVAGFIVSSLIFIMGVELLRDSVLKFLHPEETIFSIVTVVILIASIAVKCYMAAYNRSIGNHVKSPTILAAAKDSLSDCVSTAVVLASLILTRITGLHNLDAIGGLIVGCFIMYQGYTAARDTLNPLLGQAPDPEFVAQIRELMAHQSDQITGIHDLIVHDYGPGRRFVSLHAEVPANGSILELHDIIDNAEEELGRKLHCLVTIHMDPIVTDDPEVNRLKNRVTKILEHIDPRLTMHDFRTVPGKTHTNLIFDVVVPYHFHLSNDTLREQIANAARLIPGGTYHTVVHIDTDFSHTDSDNP